MSDYDEYGLKKPHKSWTERATDLVAPDPSAQTTIWDIPRALAAAPLAIGGHFMDSVPMGPFSEIRHGVEVDNYQRERAKHEPGLPYLPSERTDYSDLGPGECSPEQGDVNADGVPHMLERPREQMDDVVPTYQWMAD